MAATMTFQYSVRDRSGKMVTGKIDADSQTAVAQKLTGMGYAPVSISQVNSGMSRELKIPGFGGKVGLKDLAIFSRQFATMINSGLSMLRSLYILAEQTESKPLAEIVSQVRVDVVRRPLLDSFLFFGKDLYPQCLSHALRDVALDGEDVIQLPVIALCPEMLIALRVYQLDRHAHPVPGLPHAPLQH